MNDDEASTSRKRARQASYEKEQATLRDSFPALPDVTSGLLLQVFTDESLARPASDEEELDESIYNDNQRLAMMGERVVDLAATQVAYLERPPLPAEDLEKRRGELISDDKVLDWAWRYKLRERIRCLPEVRSTLYNPKETRNIFNAYCAAVYLESGIQVLTNWLYELTHDENGTSGQTNIGSVSEDRSQKKAKTQPSAAHPVVGAVAQPLPASQPQPPPPNPLAPAQPDAPFLPLFNQAAQSRKVTVEYIAEHVGSASGSGWEVKCIVSGITKGSGFARTKQAAKEQAARCAYYAMGWE